MQAGSHLTETVSDDDITTMLRNWFDLEEGDSDSVLAEHASIAVRDWIEVRKMLEGFDCSYCSLMHVVMWLSPDLHSKETVQEISKCHRPIRQMLGDDGRLIESDLTLDVSKALEGLRRYFFMRDDAALSRLMVKAYGSCFRTLDMVNGAGTNLWTSLMAYEKINPGCWDCEPARRMASRLYLQR